MGILLREITDENNVSVFTEDISIDGKPEKRYKLKGSFITAEQKNKNNRIYGRDVLDESIGIYDKEYIQRRRSYGELSHPEDPNLNPERAVICIESLGFKDEKDNNVYGVARLLDEECFPLAKVVRGLIKESCPVGVSFRSVGELGDDGRVKRGLMIAAVDVVMNPSNTNSFCESIMESKQWYLNGDIFIERAVSNLKQSMDKKYSSELAKQYFVKFIEDIQINSGSIL